MDSDPAAGVGALPPLDEVVLSARILAEQLINALGRDFDPQTASSVEAYPGEPLAHVKLAMLRSDVLQVLRGLTEVGRLAAGDAADRARFPDRPVRNPGEGLTPGLAAGSPPARESDGMDPTPSPAGASPDPRPHRAQRAPTGNGVRPGVGS